MLMIATCPKEVQTSTMFSVKFILNIALLISCAFAEDPTIQIKSGKLVGKSEEFSHKEVDVQRTVQVFKGIPYAEPPVGDLRFQLPQPKAPWEGVLDARKGGSACSQPYAPPIPIQEPRNEDCLFLNVFKPVSDSGNLAVMVWIHGGGFSMGSGTQDGFYDATALAAIGDVIVVSINYRLGLFGFFATGDEHALGNYGLHDQLTALKWVKENIAAFGGDPDRVTIFGESAGAFCVDFLLLSPLSDGLFHRAIMQSGAASLGGFPRPLNLPLQSKLAHGVGKVVGCERDNTEELVKCLRTVPAETFEENLDPEMSNLMNATGLGMDDVMYAMTPIVDGHYITGLTDNLFSQGAFTKTDVNIMIGSNADEGTLFLAMLMPHAMNDSEVFMNKTVYEQVWSAFLFESFKYIPAVQDAIKLMYVNWEEADSDDADYVEAYSQMQGDYMFVCPADKSARAYSKFGANVYMYHMTHVPSNPLWPVAWMKAGHGEDISFVFGSHFSHGKAPTNVTMNPEEVAMSLKVIKYWTNFAKSGNPNLSCAEEESSGEDWPLFKVPGLAYKELSPKMENKRALKAKECAFWNDFLPKLVRHTDVDTVCAAPNDEAEKYNEESNKP
ncbi:cholinesterase-like [Ptychodera flava]|uniref:cholinesterase-like n=1 Tax=Ptychodera flava TaxID=63121 RepID=UPI00396AA7A1